MAPLHRRFLQGLAPGPRLLPTAGCRRRPPLWWLVLAGLWGLLLQNAGLRLLLGEGPQSPGATFFPVGAAALMAPSTRLWAPRSPPDEGFLFRSPASGVPSPARLLAGLAASGPRLPRGAASAVVDLLERWQASAERLEGVQRALAGRLPASLVVAALESPPGDPEVVRRCARRLWELAGGELPAPPLSPGAGYPGEMRLPLDRTAAALLGALRREPGAVPREQASELAALLLAGAEEADRQIRLAIELWERLPPALREPLRGASPGPPWSGVSSQVHHALQVLQGVPPEAPGP